MFGTVFCIGWALTVLIIPRFSDKFGWRMIYTITRFADCVLYTVFIVSKNYLVNLLAIACLGALTPGRFNVGVPYMTEWFPTRHSRMVQSIRLGDSSVLVIFCTLYFWQIGNETYTIALIGYVMCLISFIFILPMPDSPRLLLATGKTE